MENMEPMEAVAAPTSTMSIFLAILPAIIVIALILIIDYLIAREFYRVAMDKGYTNKKYLWLPFFLGVVGYLLVIALPDRRHSNNNQTMQNIAGRTRYSTNSNPQYNDLPAL